jgi:hypothetical protein
MQRTKLMGKGTHTTKDGRTAKKGLYYNINQKRKRGEKMRAKGAKGAPSAQDFEDAAKTAKKADGGIYKMAGGGMYKMADGGMKNGMPGGTMVKMKNGGVFVQSRGCGAVDNKRRRPTQLK